MPTWQIEKSKRTGSSGSSCRSDAVMSAAIFQPGTDIARQPQALRQADDVGVERHDQLPRPNRPSRRPRSTSSRAHHPAQEQVQPLAARCRPTAAERNSTRRRASGRGRRPGGCRAPARASRSCRARRPMSTSAAVQSLGEEPLDRARLLEHLPQDPQQRGESTPRVQRCTIARSSGCGADGSKRAHVLGRARPMIRNSV